MASTEIEWASDVWNPVRGCRRVSPGCGGPRGEGGCYAEKTAHRFGGKGQPYEGLVTLGSNGPRWTGVGRLVPEKLAEPLSWRKRKDGTRRRCFVNSMSDLFFEEFSNEEIAAVFGVMAACPDVDFLILTKRAERLPEFERWLRKEAREANAGKGMSEIFRCLVEAQLRSPHKALRQTDRILLEPSANHCLSYREWPLPNVLLGVSVESREYLPRLDHLLETAAAGHFVSLEPLLEDIGDLSPWLHDSTCEIIIGKYATKLCTCSEPREVHLSWLIVGGESGPHARPYDIAWGESIISQCKTARVPVFHKQLGAKPFNTMGCERHEEPPCDYSNLSLRMHLKHPKGGDFDEFPRLVRVRQFPRVGS